MSPFIRSRLANLLKGSRYRHLSSSARPSRLARFSLASGVVLGTSLAVGTVYADVAEPETNQVPLSTLLRTYTVYTMCSMPFLVDHSPEILSTLVSIPVIKQMTEAFVRVTFFEQFVGGDTARETVPVLSKLRKDNKGALFAYSVEVDEAEAAGKSQRGSRTDPPVYKRIVDEMVHCIDVAADFEDNLGVSSGRRTWVAVKMTALLPDAQALINLSSHLINSRSHNPSNVDVPFPGMPLQTDLDVLRLNPAFLSPSSPLRREDVLALRDLEEDLVRICKRAQERGVKIIIDAEYSWYQPAIDALTLSLSRHFNKLPTQPQRSFFSFSSASDATITSSVQPLIYGTYQAYLRRTPQQLLLSLEDAKTYNYSLGVKLVRGAYHPHEIAAHMHASISGHAEASLSISPDAQPPVWSHKEMTDACYNACARLLLKEIKVDINESTPPGTKKVPHIGVLFGTHNRESCELILDELVKNSMAVSEEDGNEGGEVVRIGESVTERLSIGQLYGMSDALTNYLVGKIRSTSPFVIKYVPYGTLSEVLPYLSRRAIENRSVLGNGRAAHERRRAGAEIWKRFFNN